MRARAIGLDFFRRFTYKAAHFAGVRREDADLFDFWEMTGEGVKSVGIDDGWEVCLFVDCFDETHCFGGGAQAGAEGEHGHLFQEIEKLRGVVRGSVISSGWWTGRREMTTVTKPAPLR